VAEEGGAMNRPILPKDMSKYMKVVFGQEGDTTAASGPSDKAQFDFEAALKEAEASYKAWLEKNQPKLPPAVGADAEFVNVKVAGVQYVFRASQKKGIQPFRERAEGVKIAVIGKLTGSVLNVQNGKIVAIEDDNGEDLLRDEEHGGARISNIRLSRDRTIVLFEVAGRLPSEDAEGFGVIEGKMTYTSAAGTKKKELGWLELKTGAKGESGVLAVKMAHRQRQWSSLMLEVKMPQHELKRLLLYDEAGEEVEAMDQSSMRHHYVEHLEEFMPGEVEMPKEQHDRNISFQTKMPKKVKVVAEIYENLAKGELTFKLEDVDLLAR